MLWEEVFPYVLPELPDAPEILVKHYLRLTAIGFFEESQTWTTSLPLIDIVANSGTYDLVVPDVVLDPAVPLITTSADVAQIKQAWVNGQQIFPASQDELSAQQGNWDDQISGYVSHFTQLTQDTVTLYPIPSFAATGGLKVKVVLRPSLVSTGVPNWLGTKYIQEIAHGTLATMMGMVGKPWTDSQGENKYSSLFAGERTKATVEGLRSFTRTVQTVRFKNYG